MPPTEIPPTTARLLRELGASESRTAQSDDPSRQLMRLAQDPLLLHAFLMQDDRHHPAPVLLPRLACPLPSVAPLAHERQTAPRLLAYRSAFSPKLQSLWPEAFSPSEADKADVLEADDPQASFSPGLAHGVTIASIAVLLMLAVLLVL